MLDLFQKGGPVMYLLLACSLAAATVTIERIIFWSRETRNHDRKLIDDILEQAERNDYNEAARLGSGSADSIARCHSRSCS